MSLKKMSRTATLFLISLVLLESALAGPEKKQVDGVIYHVLSAPADSVRVIWKDEAGKPLRTIPAAGRYLLAQGETPDTVMNGGIFEPGGVPSGLLIQGGKKLRPVNRKNGEGNFFLQPNGIFLIGVNGAAVIRTDEYPLRGMQALHAVQSGPLLLRDGKVHPRFNANSTSRLHRNGVGVSKSGDVVFIMTDFDSPKFPNLYEFAQIFRTFGCENALFLDGDLCQMRAGDDIVKRSNRFGSMIAVIKSKNPTSGRTTTSSPDSVDEP